MSDDINNIKSFVDSINKTNIYIYILKLKENKYYIGKTTNPKFRLNNHINGDGSKWTQKYNPINLLELIPNCEDFDEDKYTLSYMKKYGVENVRGGTFTQMNFTNDIIIMLNKMLNNEENKCFTCNEIGHFASECNKNNINEICYNCKKPGHYSKDCKIQNYFKCEYCDRTFETKNGKQYHIKFYCKNK